MAYVVTEAGIKCKYTDCVDNCPTACFREGVNMLVIDPTDCIDCNLCADQYPVVAIYPDIELPEHWEKYIEINERLGALWPEITRSKDALESAEEFSTVENKDHLLDESPFEEE